MSGISQWVPYCGAAPLPAELMGRWNFDPVLLVALFVMGAAYGRMAGGFPLHRRLAFSGAFAILLLVFVSPLCALSSALFSARVVHHLLLAAMCAPLLVMAMPRDMRPLPGNLTFWTAAQAVIFWVWHAPPVYEAALSSDALYWIMQVALLGSAVAFWDNVRRAPGPAAAGALLASMVQMGLLGALITFAPDPLYAPHFLTTAAWGWSPLEDQQLAGLIMWVPAAGVYLAAALVLLGRSLQPGRWAA